MSPSEKKLLESLASHSGKISAVRSRIDMKSQELEVTLTCRVELAGQHLSDMIEDVAMGVSKRPKR